MDSFISMFTLQSEITLAFREKNVRAHLIFFICPGIFRLKSDWYFQFFLNPFKLQKVISLILIDVEGELIIFMKIGVAWIC